MAQEKSMGCLGPLFSFLVVQHCIHHLCLWFLSHACHPPYHVLPPPLCWSCCHMVVLVKFLIVGQCPLITVVVLVFPLVISVSIILWHSLLLLLCPPSSPCELLMAVEWILPPGGKGIWLLTNPFTLKCELQFRLLIVGLCLDQKPYSQFYTVLYTHPLCPIGLHLDTQTPRTVQGLSKQSPFRLYSKWFNCEIVHFWSTVQVLHSAGLGEISPRPTKQHVQSKNWTDSLCTTGHMAIKHAHSTTWAK
jgi:hypothetical protein